MKKSFVTFSVLFLSGLAIATFYAANLAPATAQEGAPAMGARKGQKKGQKKGQNKKGKGKNARQNQGANAVAGDLDAANAPIPDRDVAKALPKELKQAPQLGEIVLPVSNFPIPASKVIFAAPGGMAASDGRDRARPTTLTKAVESAPAGATIVLKGGEYRDVADVKIARRLTLQSAPGEVVWIKGSDIVTGWQSANGAYQVAWDKKFTHTNEQDVEKSNPVAAETDMVFVAGRALRQVLARSEVAPGTFFVDSAAKTLVLGDDPTGKIVEVTARQGAFQGSGKAAAGLTMRGLNIAHYAGVAVEFTGNGATFENNVFAWNGTRGLTLRGPEHVVRGNTLACNGLSGMAGTGVSKMLFENNRVLFNNIEGFRKTWSAAGIKIIVSKDGVFRNNIVEGNNSMGMWFDISDLRTHVIGNTVKQNQSLGIFFELCHEGIIAFNTVVDNGVGIMLADSSSARVWNNTLVDNSKGILVKDSPRVNLGKTEGWYKGAPDDLAAGATWITTGNEIKNNLLIGGRNDKTALLEAVQAGKGKVAPDMIRALGSNAYARSGKVPRVLVRWNGSGKPVDFESLDAFRAAQAGFEADSTLLAVSPFVGTKNYSLPPNSPLLRAGTAIPAEIKAAALAAGITLPTQARIGALGVQTGA